MIDFITFCDYTGTFAFAISGIRLASAKQFDWFGAYVVGVVTAVGGGTIRDILLNATPFWMEQASYLIISALALLFVIIFRKYVISLNNTFFIFDTIGLGVYTVIGIQIGLTWGYSPMLGICLGTLTACFGGVVRDLLCNEIPLIFHREIYATISVVGGIVYTVMLYLGVSEMITTLVTLFGIIATRFLVVRYKLSMPAINLHDNMPNG